MSATKYRLAAFVAASLLACAPALAQQAAPDPGADSKRDDNYKPVTDASKANEDDIAKESENPIGNLTILPFENYTNFQVGPNKGTQNILEFEPVVPIHLNADWNLINRAIIPVVWNPDLSPAPSVPQAFAPTDFSAFLSPRNPVHGWTWGVGRSSSSRPPPARPSAPVSGAWARPPLSSIPPSISSPACLSTSSGRSAAWNRARAAGAMRGSSWSPSSTTISATAGS